MKILAPLVLVLALFTNKAHAYIPPCSYMLKKITSERPTKRGAILYLSIFKPAETDKGNDTLISEETVFFNQDSNLSEGEWPTVSLLLESNGERLVHDLRAFGLRLPEEKDLLRYRHDQVISMKEMPNPFYLQEKGVSLHRFRKNSYVWACEETAQKTALWIEKDNFVPAMLKAPCPSFIGDGAVCSVEFQNAWNLPEAKNARMIVRKDDKLLYIVHVDHVIINPSAAQFKSAKENALKKANAPSELALFFH